ncbi:MAG TPA: GntR family transcriptional regulator [Gammaproteobacteria bacterium]|jgi:GntR family transcriptional regulator|nr:GntR family transcriptional regulator [Gammaproteobacteria bacterium]HIK72338.1 GntR family transcriptional regulator [Gammaproteobacteria bacterium]
MQWTSEQPIYQQVRDHIVSLIIDGVLKSGDPIPSVRQMAVEGGVNPLTVSKAYQELVDLEIVEKRRGLGMFIKNSAKKQLLKLEKDKFLKNNWPKIVKKANQLDIDLFELIKKS